MVTIKDIAKHAGVSYATVSRALNGVPEVKETTRLHIEKIAREMGYTPNAVAVSLITKRTHSIAVIVPDIANPFFSDIVQTISLLAEKQGYTTIVCNTNWDPQSELDKINFMKERRVDGIVLKPARMMEPEYFHSIGIPTVLLAQSMPSDLSFVEVDSRRGGYLATQHLLEKGYHNIALLNGLKSSFSDAMRKKGYIDALREAGIAYNARNVSNGEFSVQSGYQRMKSLWTKQKDAPLDAVFCGNDIIALGALRFLAEQGIDVPGRFGVVGYDDISFAALPQVMLTTIAQPRKIMGENAVDLLFEMIDHQPEKHVKKVMLLPELVVRETTR